MNILLVNDDGPKAQGLQILRRTTRLLYPTSQITTLSTKNPTPGMGMSVSLHGQLESLDLLEAKVDEDTYALDLRPADLILAAFFRKDLFLPPEQAWDLVLSGINHGQNVGFDVFYSGTVGQSLVAAAAFGCTAIALGQDLGHKDVNRMSDNANPVFQVAEKWLPEVIGDLAPIPGECWNVNFPTTEPKAIKHVPVAHYSDWLTPPTQVVPRAKLEESDITELKKGNITISQLSLRVNQPLRF